LFDQVISLRRCAAQAAARRNHRKSFHGNGFPLHADTGRTAAVSRSCFNRRFYHQSNAPIKGNAARNGGACASPRHARGLAGRNFARFTINSE